MSAGPPKRDRLREKPQLVADELRHLIVSGQLTEGESLGREPELIERFGVSRPSLREALRILEAEGLITVVRDDAAVHPPHDRDQPLGLEDAQRLPQRRPGHAEALDELRLPPQ